MNILSIAGSDPSSGAGIQGDIKTFTSHGIYGLTVITAITSQNTKKFQKAEAVSSKMIKTQLDSIFTDFKIDAIKIGMVYNKDIIKGIYSKLKNLKIPIIVDPVIQSTTGGELLKKNALGYFKKFIVPLAYIITPNVSEAEKLAGMKISKKEDLQKCAKKIKSLGARNVIITGFPIDKKRIADFVLEDGKNFLLLGNKIPKLNHGSGCIFSATLTVATGQRKKIQEAAKFAKEFSYRSMKNSLKIGKGIQIAQVENKKDNRKLVLENAIQDFVNMKKGFQLIPECQTNFVFTKSNPKSTRDILGVEGRIVRAGKQIIPSGIVKYRGSKHVASAVFEINKKFPSLTSAINIKYNTQMVKKMKRMGFSILSYDRKQEPKKVKQKENSSISWGIKNAIKNSISPPDAVYHKGDFGKEAMILVFGKDPQDIVTKVRKILRN